MLIFALKRIGVAITGIFCLACFILLHMQHMTLICLKLELFAQGNMMEGRDTIFFVSVFFPISEFILKLSLLGPTYSNAFLGMCKFRTFRFFYLFIFFFCFPVNSKVLNNATTLVKYNLTDSFESLRRSLQYNSAACEKRK